MEQRQESVRADGVECEKLGTAMDPEGHPGSSAACPLECSATTPHSAAGVSTGPPRESKRHLTHALSSPGTEKVWIPRRLETTPWSLTLSSAIFPRGACCAGAAPPPLPHTKCPSLLRAEALPGGFFFERLEALS